MQDPELAATVLLVAAAQQGDRQALETLFERYLPRVRRIAAVRLGKTAAQFAELEDVVQDSLTEAFRALASFEHQSDGGFCNWLARCVENNVTDLVRRGQAQKRGAGRVQRRADLASGSWSSALPGKEPTPSQAAGAHELDEQIERAILRLKPNYREVIILRTACGMSAREVAAEMGLATPEDAQKLFERARQRLAALLEGG